MSRYNLQAEDVSLRLIENEDAHFIVDLRTDQRLGQNLSHTSSKVEDQIDWIIEYKKREAEKKEFYFIFEDSNKKPWGTVRLYNFNENSFTIGSWICLPNNKDKIAIKAWLLCVEFGFETLNFDVLLFDVRKKNTSVLYYAKLYHPILIAEDELNYFFELHKATFYKNREKVIKLLNIKMS
jgi:RimJ/RimL family protein N-acetyltransferase